MNRPIGVTLLAIGAGLAGLYEIWRALVFMGIVNFTFLGEEVSFPTAQWGQTIWALIIAAIWFWVAVGFWNVRAYAWSFGIFISIFTLIFGFMSLLFGSTMESETVGWFLALVIFLYLNYPGVREHFVKTELDMLTPEQRAAYDQLQAANMAAAQANAAASAPTPAAAPAPAAPRASCSTPGGPAVGHGKHHELGHAAGAASQSKTGRERIPGELRPRVGRYVEPAEVPASEIPSAEIPAARRRHRRRHRPRYRRRYCRHRRHRRNLSPPGRQAGTRTNRTGRWRSPCRRTRRPACSGTCRQSQVRRGSRRVRASARTHAPSSRLAQLGSRRDTRQAFRIVAGGGQLALGGGRGQALDDLLPLFRRQGGERLGVRPLDLLWRRSPEQVAVALDRDFVGISGHLRVPLLDILLERTATRSSGQQPVRHSQPSAHSQVSPSRPPSVPKPPYSTNVSRAGS